MFTRKVCYICGDQIDNEAHYDFTDGDYPEGDDSNEYAHIFCYDHDEPRDMCEPCYECERQFNYQQLEDGLCPECVQKH